VAEQSGLNGFAQVQYSQFGEDGIVAEALARIPGRTSDSRWCVDVGAGDGLLWSNTASLIRDDSFAAILIEADPVRLARARDNHPGPNVHTVAARVSSSGPSSLDGILARTPCPPQFDVLSIDVDGMDYHILASLTGYRPNVVVIEFNPTIPNEVVYIQPRDDRVRQGCSARAIVELAQSKGYALVATTYANLVFVAQEHADDVLGSHRPTLAELRDDQEARCFIFAGYDGSLITNHPVRLPWHGGLEVPSRRLQILPAALRRYPPDYSAPQLALVGLTLAVRAPKQAVRLAMRRLGH
jgi:hypothetical protein